VLAIWSGQHVLISEALLGKIQVRSVISPMHLSVSIVNRKLLPIDPPSILYPFAKVIVLVVENVLATALVSQ
jgi:hypothetical protein